VRKEVVDKGKQLKHKDAFLIEKAIQEGWLKVAKTDFLKSPIELGTGELAVISLAKKLSVKEVLIDETPARTGAKLAGLEARGTIFVLLKALERKKINLEEFLDSLHQLTLQGFRLNEEVYLDGIRQARKMTSA
jgi:predicted nucleic acid-binding protein